MKKFSFYALVAFAAAFAFTACSEDTTVSPDESNDSTDTSTVYAEVVKTGVLTADESWSADTVYVLDGRVTVAKDVTLTIAAGTVIKGEDGLGANASALMVAIGGKLMAEGTAAEPIIMTSIKDDIQPGQLKGSNLDELDRGLWGGLVILGDAPISAETEVAQIEGVPQNDENGRYGGTNDDHNAGVLNYISIRHGGSEIDGGSEINGLTLGGVGAATSISNIEVYANKDDGIEFFGGAVSVTNLLIGFQGDDGIDIDQSYSGTVSNFVVIHGISTDEGLEIDGPEGDMEASFTLENGFVVCADTVGSAADFKSKAMGSVTNVAFSNYPESTVLKFRASYSTCPGSEADRKTDAFTNLLDGALTISSSSFDGVKVYTKSEGCDDIDAAAQAEAEAKLTSATASGADITVFDSWTLASQLAKLDAIK